MKRLLAALAMIATALGAHASPMRPAIDTVSFIVDGYYFELNPGSQCEFYAAETLSASPVGKERFKHVLRLELPTDGTSYRSIDISRAARAQSVWNPSKRRLAAACGERIIVLSADYSMLKCYRSVELVRWITDFELFVTVRTDRPAPHDREHLVIDVETDGVKKAAGVSLAASDMTSGADVEPADRIVVEKSKRRLTLLRKNRELAVYRVALGREPDGPKIMVGDNKTPEGLYFVDYKVRNSVYHRALHLTYPNLDDVARADSLGVSPGGDIMIHGLGRKQQWMGDVQYLFDWTNGCIALTNGEIEEIWNLVQLWTPVEIRP